MKSKIHENHVAIRYGVTQSTLGCVLVATSRAGVCAILLGEQRAALEQDLRRRFAAAELNDDTQHLHKLLQAVQRLVDQPEHALAAPLDLRGTPFQRRVWQALREIPAGSTASYADIAARVGARKAVRAVAQACGANPVAIAIPCHRVVRSDGALSGYRWGIERKRALLERERQAHARPSPLGAREQASENRQTCR